MKVSLLDAASACQLDLILPRSGTVEPLPLVVVVVDLVVDGVGGMEKPKEVVD